MSCWRESDPWSFALPPPTGTPGPAGLSRYRGLRPPEFREIGTPPWFIQGVFRMIRMSVPHRSDERRIDGRPGRGFAEVLQKISGGSREAFGGTTHGRG